MEIQVLLNTYSEEIITHTSKAERSFKKKTKGEPMLSKTLKKKFLANFHHIQPKKDNTS